MRRADVEGAYASVVQKGDPDAGAAVIKVRTLDGRATLYLASRDMNGERVWHPKGPLDEFEIDKIIERRMATDPDLWIIEIDDRKGRHFLTDRVEE